MASTLIVLAILLICGIPLWLIAFAATSLLAKRNGQAVKKMSWSFRHGFSAEFFKPKNHRAGKPN
jgi:hypothetical protein